MYVPLHHPGGESAGFDGFTVLLIVAVLAVVGAVGFGIWWLIQRRTYA